MKKFYLNEEDDNDNCHCCDDYDNDERFPLSETDIETQDDYEVWQRFIMGEEM